MPRHRTLTLAAALLLCAPASADARRFTIRGAGFGHGVGMSQYGALGLAEHGWDHRRILAHYYTGTGLGRLTAPREVRVLLQTTSGAARLLGASRAGDRELEPGRTYAVRARSGGRTELLGPRGRVLAAGTGVLRVTGPGPLVLRGRAINGRTDGAYRGALEFRPSAAGGVNAINAVDVEGYVQGVVPLESPASWPAAALQAQAVAARTYALTTSKGGAGFEQYPDTRSQVYGGVGAEQPSTNAATQATAGQLVTYQGTPVPTYFFSTSGGRTEDVENSALGGAPQPWLRSVEDPYDDVSPKHRWGPIRMSTTAAGRRLRGLVHGRFRGIEVVRRGRSPRIVAADVVGSRGRTRVTGATLRARFGLYDSWAYFTSIRTRRAPVPAAPVPPPAVPPPVVPGTGGTGAGAGVFALGARPAGALAGSVLPSRRGAKVRIERRVRGAWIPAGTSRLGRGGRYRAAVGAPGTYRVRYRGDAGEIVRIGPR